MGIVKTFYPNSNSIISIWKIKESIEELNRLIDNNLEIKNIIKQKEYLSSRLLIKDMCKNFGIKYSSINKNLNGKPFLLKKKEFISISHKFPYSVAIINKKNECGIDIEKINEKVLIIKNKFLNKNEISNVGRSVKKATIFWSIKEAIYKIKGETIPFKNIHISKTDTNKKYVVKINELKYNIKILELDNHIISYSI